MGQNLFNNLRKHQPFNHKQHYIFQKPAWVASSFLNLLEVERKPKIIQGDTCALFLLCSQLSGHIGARFVASFRFLFSKAKWLDSKLLSPPRRRQTLTLGFYFHHNFSFISPNWKYKIILNIWVSRVFQYYIYFWFEQVSLPIFFYQTFKNSLLGGNCSMGQLNPLFPLGEKATWKIWSMTFLFIITLNS